MVAGVAAGKQPGRGVNTVAEVIEIDDEEQPAGTRIDHSRHVFELVSGTAFGLCICSSGGPAWSSHQATCEVADYSVAVPEVDIVANLSNLVPDVTSSHQTVQRMNSSEGAESSGVYLIT